MGKQIVKSNKDMKTISYSQMIDKQMEISYEQLQSYIEKIQGLEINFYNNSAYIFVGNFINYLIGLLDFYQKSNVIFQL